MENLKNKMASIAKRYDELVRETIFAITAMAEKGLKIEPEEALNNDYYVANFRGVDCVLCGLKLDTLNSNNVVVLLMPTNGEDAHTITEVSLRFISTEDKIYMAKYITKHFEFEKIKNPLIECC